VTEWREVTLGDVIQLQRGFDLTEKEAEPGPYPVISSGGVSYSTSTAKVEGPGVVTGRKGVLGKVHYSEGAYWPHDTTLWVKDFKGSEPQFIYYWLQTLPLAELDGGAANPTLNRNHAHLLPVRIPDLRTQRLVAEILGSIDDLMESSHRRITLLEQIAEAIYREWFVQFRYPGAEGDELVDSSLGRIPEGWKVERLKDLASIVMGQSPKSEHYNESGDGLPFHQGVSNFGQNYPRHRFYCRIDGRMAEAGDHLVSVRAPVGRINRADQRLVIGRGLAAVRSNGGFQTLLGQQLRQVFREEDVMGGGTIFKAITKRDLEGVEILQPVDPVARLSEATMEPIDLMLRSLTFGTRALGGLRDLLLPKLVTGAIDVSRLDLDRFQDEPAA
jgi:type I restriction enzyme S subunit